MAFAISTVVVGVKNDKGDNENFYCAPGDELPAKVDKAELARLVDLGAVDPAKSRKKAAGPEGGEVAPVAADTAAATGDTNGQGQLPGTGA